jgi:hypothetical protein
MHGVTFPSGSWKSSSLDSRTSANRSSMPSRSGEIVCSATASTAWMSPSGTASQATIRSHVSRIRLGPKSEFWGRNRWERGVFVGSDDIEPTDLAWAHEDGDDEDEEEAEETIDPEAADTAADVLATVADRILASRGLRLSRATGLSRLADIAAPLGDAARVSHLMDAAHRGYGVEPTDARFAVGDGSLVEAFCTHLAVAGGHALLTAAAYRMKAEQDIGFHTALHRVFDETAEGAYDSTPEALTGPSPADWLAQVLDYLGDSVNLLHAEALWEEVDVLPDWVRRLGATGAEAASNAFLVLASNCLCAIASLCPESIEADAIDLIGPDDELRAVQDPRGPATRGRFGSLKRGVS